MPASSDDDKDVIGGGAGPERVTVSADDLLSITVRKSEPDQKSGISLVERAGYIYVTKIAENGLFHDSGLGVGDMVMSINGKRLRKGEGPAAMIKVISKAANTVTLVIKKAGKKAKRGARSLSPDRRMKLSAKQQSIQNYQGMARRNPDGSLRTKYNPNDPAWKNEDQTPKEVRDVAANKIFPEQDAGLDFQIQDRMLFVSYIAIDSIFQDTKLEVGDRVININEMNFESYADANYARKVISKANDVVTVRVEKGHTEFKYDPSQRAEESSSSSNKQHQQQSRGRTRGSVTRGLPPPSPRKAEINEPSPKKPIIPLQASYDSSDESETELDDNNNDEKTKHQELLTAAFKVTNLMDGFDHHDFIRVTVRKAAVDDSGIVIEKRSDKFILSQLPETETRLSIGNEVLAICGSSSGITLLKNQTQLEIEDLLEESKFSVVLIVNFDDPVLPSSGGSIASSTICSRCGGNSSTSLLTRQTDDDSTAAESVATAKVGNSGGGSRPGTAAAVTSIPERRSTSYNLDDYNTDSESEDDDSSSSE